MTPRRRTFLTTPERVWESRDRASNHDSTLALLLLRFIETGFEPGIALGAARGVAGGVDGDRELVGKRHFLGLIDVGVVGGSESLDGVSERSVFSQRPSLAVDAVAINARPVFSRPRRIRAFLAAAAK